MMTKEDIEAIIDDVMEKVRITGIHDESGNAQAEISKEDTEEIVRKFVGERMNEQEERNQEKLDKHIGYQSENE